MSGELIRSNWNGFGDPLTGSQLLDLSVNSSGTVYVSGVSLGWLRDSFLLAYRSNGEQLWASRTGAAHQTMGGGIEATGPEIYATNFSGSQLSFNQLNQAGIIEQTTTIDLGAVGGHIWHENIPLQITKDVSGSFTLLPQ